MAEYSQGDIILIQFPYSDLSNSKQRPAVIISKHTSRFGNFIVAKITSVEHNDRFSFNIELSDTDRPLPKKSEVRTNELFTVNRSLIRRERLCSFTHNSLCRLTEKIKGNISV